MEFRIAELRIEGSAFDQMHSPSLFERLVQVDKRFEQVERRFEDLRGDMNTRFGEMRSDMRDQFERVDRRFERIAKGQSRAIAWLTLIIAVVSGVSTTIAILLG